MAFYGKFQYFKEYDRDDAILIRNIFIRNKMLNEKYYPVRIIKGKKNFIFLQHYQCFVVTILVMN